MANTATRLITLIMLLQQRPNRKAADLAEALGVSVRTFHRYVDMLDDMGIPVYSERGPHGGFSLVRGYKLPPLVFTPEEAVAIYLGTNQVIEMWGQLYREAAQGALAKLQNVLPDEQLKEIGWAQRSLVATHMHRADFTRYAPLLDVLRRATREQRGVAMVYQSTQHPDPVRRECDPYAMVHRWGWWYVIGYCHLREAIRTFRVDRIVSLELLEKTFDLPEDFDVHEYLRLERPAKPLLVVKIRFLPEAVLMVRDDPAFWETVEEQPDGSVIVTISTESDLNWAARMVLGLGPDVEVLEPPELRRLVSDWAQAIVARYEP